jgi:hypothetical protein
MEPRVKGENSKKPFQRQNVVEGPAQTVKQHIQMDSKRCTTGIIMIHIGTQFQLHEL